MKRILILGCSGGGKSTFAARLHEIIHIELIHLDRYFWKAGWVESEQSEWQQTVTELIQKDSWIMDGDYENTMDMRLSRADTIIFFDMPTLLCLFNVITRVFKTWWGWLERKDMAEGCPERFDLEFYRWILGYKKKYRESYLNKFKAEPDKELFIISHYKQAEQLLIKIKKDGDHENS